MQYIPDFNDPMQLWIHELFESFEYNFHRATRKLITDCILYGSSSRKNIGKTIFNREIRNAVRLFSLDMISEDSKDKTPRCCPKWYKNMSYSAMVSCYYFAGNELLNTIDITIKKPDEWKLSNINPKFTILYCDTCRPHINEMIMKIENNKQRKRERKEKKLRKKEYRDENREFREKIVDRLVQEPRKRKIKEKKIRKNGVCVDHIFSYVASYNMNRKVIF